jgi:alanine-glyoxylate transaminase/serine-glyoxylate transaminase/serine-pyruvate transaminase
VKNASFEPGVNSVPADRSEASSPAATKGISMAGRNFLFVPGPTNVPDRVTRAMHVAMEDHRSTSFPALTIPLFADLKRVFKTAAGQCFIFPSSGTGGWEASLTNTLSPGDKVLSARFGQFSHLWIEMAERLGLDVQVLETEWGEGAPVERIAEALTADRHHAIKAVMVVHNETATGVTSDIAGVRAAMDAARHPALLFVDGVSSIGAIDFRMDEWKVDCAVTGTQKALMLPPGVAVVCVSPKALAAGAAATLPRVYFDFKDHIGPNASGYFPYTPPIPMLYGMRESVSMLLEEGLDNVVARHHRLAEGVRAAVRAWGLELCARAPRWHSDTVSAILVPPHVKGEDVISTAFTRYNLSLGAGLSKVAGKVFRIGHMGDLNEVMLLGALAGTEMAMRDVGIAVVPGSGVAAAAEFWRNTRAAQSPIEQPVAAGRTR